jgi:alanine racemase
MKSPHVQVSVSLKRIRRSTADVARRVDVPIIAVVKTDAYGLGAARVAEAIADLVGGFCVFSLSEAESARLWDIGTKPILALGPCQGIEPKSLISAHVRPAVWTIEEARRLRSAAPVLCVDTGMRRFSCPPEDIDRVLAAADFDEAFTHAIRVEQAVELSSLLSGRGLRLHAAGSALLNEPRAFLDAVRPGIALYRGAARISTPLVEVHDGPGPAGYSGFSAERFGVILCGYSNGLRVGPCRINDVPRAIREVGMQSAFVEIGPGDRVGDSVVLLGNSLSEAEVAASWKTSEQQVLVTLANAGERVYLKD